MIRFVAGVAQLVRALDCGSGGRGFEPHRSPHYKKVNMKVTIKKLKDLERKITISVDVENYDAKFDAKIKNIKTKAKIDGFRKGNVPNDVLEQRYGQSIHNEVINELIQDSYPKAITDNDLRPAASPQVSIESEDSKKPIIYSSLLVGLYVISDFGAVSLMKYGTMTKAIYSYYVININGDPVIFYSTILIFLALIISFAQRGSDISRSAKVSGTPREIEKIKLSKKPKILVLTFFFVLIFFSLFVPVSVLGYWLFRGLAQGNTVSGALSGILGSLTAATVTSILAMVIATPIVVMISQYRSKFGDLFEKVTLTLYGLPHIAVGISMLFITIKIFPSIYQTFITLIISYLIVFLPQAVGGGQASMEQVKLSYIEASSGLGFSKIDTFFKITFPLIYRGLLAGAALVFLSTMKELPQTLLLRPTGFSTMAVDIWSNASEALFTQAAFSAFILLAISAFPTYILSTRNLTN